MAHNDDLQRSEEWFKQRAGIPTASRFSDLMTDPRTKADKEAGKLSQTAQSYALELIAEKLTGERKEFSSPATDWGNYNEPFAIAEYQDLTGNQVLECGFIKHKTIPTGASPDGLVLGGCVEVKCPYNTVNHLNNVLSGEIPKEYYPQVQGQIWICELEWVDFISFDPRISGMARISVVRVERDDKFIKELESRILRFNDYLNETLAKLEGF